MGDFTDLVDNIVQLTESTDEETTTFVDVGDFDSIVISGTGFGEGGFGEGAFGGTQSVIVTAPPTVWTDITTP